jgi:hypothetical protein
MQVNRKKNRPISVVKVTKAVLSHEFSAYFSFVQCVIQFLQCFSSEVSRVAQSVQCLATGWTTGRSRIDPRQGQRIFPLASMSRPALGPTQPPVQWVPGVLSPGVKRGRGVTLTTHPYLVPVTWMSRSYTFSPQGASVACSGTALDFFSFPKAPADHRCSAVHSLRNSGITQASINCSPSLGYYALHLYQWYSTGGTRRHPKILFFVI